MALSGVHPSIKAADVEISLTIKQPLDKTSCHVECVGTPHNHNLNVTRSKLPPKFSGFFRSPCLLVEDCCEKTVGKFIALHCIRHRAAYLVLTLKGR